MTYNIIFVSSCHDIVTCDEDLDVSTASLHWVMRLIGYIWITDRAQSFFSDWPGFESFN